MFGMSKDGLKIGPFSISAMDMSSAKKAPAAQPSQQAAAAPSALPAQRQKIRPLDLSKITAILQNRARLGTA
jgi:hypothetical protein